MHVATSGLLCKGWTRTIVFSTMPMYLCLHGQSFYMNPKWMKGFFFLCNHEMQPLWYTYIKVLMMDEDYFSALLAVFLFTLFPVKHEKIRNYANRLSCFHIGNSTELVNAKIVLTLTTIYTPNNIWLGLPIGIRFESPKATIEIVFELAEHVRKAYFEVMQPLLFTKHPLLC